MVMDNKILEENKRIIESLNGFTCPFFISEEQSKLEKILSESFFNSIREGLIKTYPINTTAKKLSDYGYVVLGADKTQIYLQTFKFNQFNLIKTLINTYGYFIEKIKILKAGQPKSPENYLDFNKIEDLDTELNKDNISDFWLIISPKFDYIAKKLNVSRLFHLTKKSNVGKIIEKGLIPRSQGKKSHHPDRIYVSINKNTLEDIYRQFSVNHETEYVVLTIDYNKAGQPELYNDLNYLSYGYYLIDNIKPSAIINIEDAKNIFSYE